MLTIIATHFPTDVTAIGTLISTTNTTQNGYVIFPQSAIQSHFNIIFGLQKFTYILAADLTTLGANLIKMESNSKCMCEICF